MQYLEHMLITINGFLYAYGCIIILLMDRMSNG